MAWILLLTAILVMVCLLGRKDSVYAREQHIFQDLGQPLEERVEEMVSLMTIEEKIDCLGTNPRVPRIGIKGSGHVEGLHGLAMGGPGGWGGDSPICTTQFPQAIGLAETWDPELLRMAAEIESHEARYVFQRYGRGGLVVRAPNCDLGRDPRWGRTEECYGEDPYLNGVMAVAFVRGLQGDHPKYWRAAALLKHFLANSNENNRNSSSSDFNERLLREYYSVPFRMAIMEGGARAYMTAYNAYNGIPCMVHPILREITIDEWGQDGIICTDAGALEMLVTAHRYYHDIATAAASAVKAGINQFLDEYREAVRTALNKGLLSGRGIDEAIKGTFRVMIKLGLLDPPHDNPYASIGLAEAQDPWDSEKHRDVARLITQKSIVLLKNDKKILPLDRESIRSIAVIGPWADEVLLDWYSGLPPYRISPLEGIKNKVEKNITVRYSDGNKQEEIVKTAGSSDVAIVCVGNHPTGKAGWAECPVQSDGKEAVDRRSISLEQEQLVKEVYQANRNTILVLISSFPFAIVWSNHNIPAILHVTHNSQELGSALADVLFGEVNPGGRLVQTWPRNMEQLPPMMDYDLRNGRTYMYFKGEPLYHFGYGLSYTTFSYYNLRTNNEILQRDGEITISVDIKNTGVCIGDEVVQFYIKYLNSNELRPNKELKGFKRISLHPGEARTIRFPLKYESLAYWNTDKGRFEVEPGEIKVMVGASSRRIKLEKVIKVMASTGYSSG